MAANSYCALVKRHALMRTVNSPLPTPKLTHVDQKSGLNPKKKTKFNRTNIRRLNRQSANAGLDRQMLVNIRALARSALINANISSLLNDKVK